MTVNAVPVRTRTALARVDRGEFRRVLGHYPTGVCVVTAHDPRTGPVGMTVGSFTSVSLDPPLVAFFPMRGSATFASIAAAGRFCVNILTKDQEHICRLFASRDSDKFRDLPWRPSPLGSPVLPGVVAWVDCRLATVHDAGDHLAVFGEVHRLALDEPTIPLMFLQGGYGGFSAMSLTAPADSDLTRQLQLADLARPQLEQLAHTFGVEAHASALAGDQVIQLAWAGADRVNLRASKVGLRLPFRPPMGLLFIAWADQAAQGRWLDQCGRRLAHRTRAAYAAEVARAREQGWIAVPDHDRLRAIEAAVLRMAAEGQTAIIERELNLQLDHFAEAYTELVAIAADQTPSGFSAPVFDKSGAVALVISVQDLTRLTPADVERCRSSLVTTAAALTNPR